MTIQERKQDLSLEERRMRGAEGDEERGADEGSVWGRCILPTKFCTIHVRFVQFAAFCEDYDSLRLMKFTELQ